MINRLKRTIFTYFAIPFTGLLLLILFFFVLLQPAQRNAIFKNILASLPVAKNFVNTHYKTHLNVKNVVDAKNLKTSFVSIDFLASIRNAKGENYIAVYPFQVEAGFDLEQSSVNIENENHDVGGYRKIDIHLPRPHVLTVDLDEKSSVLVVRGDMEGDSEYITRPVRMAFEKQARQYSIQKGILEKAMENATAYFENLFQEIYDEINITFEEPSEKNVVRIKLPFIPLNFALIKNNFDYEFHGYEDMRPVVATFKNGNSDIKIGYSQKATASYTSIWKNLKNDASDKVFLKYIDPVSPQENGVVCEYGKSSEAICYIQKEKNVFFLRHRPVNDEYAKTTLADLLYASFNTQSGGEDIESVQYLKFVSLLKEAEKQLNDKKYANLQRTAEKIIGLHPDNAYGHLLAAIAESNNRNSYTPLEGFPNIDLLLRLYHLIKYDHYEKIDQNIRKDVFSQLHESTYSDFLNNFRSCLLVKKDKINLSEEEGALYLKSLLESGMTDGIIKTITPNQFLQALKIKLYNINSKLNKKNQAEQNLLYCPAGGDTSSGFNFCDASVVYDLYSFNGIYKKGHETATRVLAEILEDRGINVDLDNTLIAIVTRSLLSTGIFADYDAFILNQERLVVVKDLLNDKEDISLITKKYDHLNLGNEEFNFEGDEYNNKALVELLRDLRSESVGTEEDTNQRVLKYLKDKIRELAVDEIRVPALS